MGCEFVSGVGDEPPLLIHHGADAFQQRVDRCQKRLQLVGAPFADIGLKSSALLASSSPAGRNIGRKDRPITKAVTSKRQGTSAAIGSIVRIAASPAISERISSLWATANLLPSGRVRSRTRMGRP